MMKCPMSFNDSLIFDGVQCQPHPLDCMSNCAWLMESGTERADKVCAIAVLASSGTEPMGFAPVNVIERGA